MREPVMIDPSILLDIEKLDILERSDEKREKFKFYIPYEFYFIIKEGKENNLTTLYDFFEAGWKINTPEFKLSRPDITRIVNSIEMLKMREILNIYKIPKEYEKDQEFYDNLSKVINNDMITKIIFEEWAFLQKHSTMVSKIKKPFEKFKEAGAVAIEISRKSLDRIVRKTIRKEDNPDHPLMRPDYLRALGKWIGVVLTSATVFVSPVAAFMIGVGDGAFMLMDP